MSNAEYGQVLVPTASGQSLVCRYCGTLYDTAVDLSDYCPPVGDGCEHCDPDEN